MFNYKKTKIGYIAFVFALFLMLFCTIFTSIGYEIGKKNVIENEQEEIITDIQIEEN